MDGRENVGTDVDSHVLSKCTFALEFLLRLRDLMLCYLLLLPRLADTVLVSRFGQPIEGHGKGRYWQARFAFKLFEAAFSLSRNKFVPIQRESSIWSNKTPFIFPLTFWTSTQGSARLRCMSSSSRWWAGYVRYQWSPLSGILYSGLTALRTLPGLVQALPERVCIHNVAMACAIVHELG